RGPPVGALTPRTPSTRPKVDSAPVLVRREARGSMDLAGATAPPAARDPAAAWCPLEAEAALANARAAGAALEELRSAARKLRDLGKGRTITYSRKAFFPVTTLCRDRCAYCTFRRDEGEDGAWTMTPDELRAWAERARHLDCVEALLCI